MRALRAVEERWPTAGAFVIARGARTEAQVVVVEIDEAGDRGRGEAAPYARYDESVTGVLDQIEGVRGYIEAGADRQALQRLLPAGAARNAIDCALWDLEAKQSGVRAWALAGLPRLDPVKTAYTLSLGSPAAMGEAAAAAARRPMLKIKLGAGVQALVGAERDRAVEAFERLVLTGRERLLDKLDVHGRKGGE